MVESLSSYISEESNLQLPFDHGHKLGLGFMVSLASKDVKSSPFIICDTFE